MNPVVPTINKMKTMSHYDFHLDGCDLLVNICRLINHLDLTMDDVAGHVETCSRVETDTMPQHQRIQCAMQHCSKWHMTVRLLYIATNRQFNQTSVSM